MSGNGRSDLSELVSWKLVWSRFEVNDGKFGDVLLIEDHGIPLLIHF